MGLPVRVGCVRDNRRPWNVSAVRAGSLKTRFQVNVILAITY